MQVKCLMAGETDLVSFSQGDVMQQGEVVNNRYSVEKTIGGGAYGTVYLVEDLDRPGQKLALKEIVEHELSPEERKDAVELFCREAKILMGLKFEGLPAVMDSFSITDPLTSLGHHYLVMEHINGETLETIQKRDNAPFSSSEVILWALQLARIIHYLHSQKPSPLIFRDLKPSNTTLLTVLLTAIDIKEAAVLHREREPCKALTR